MCAKYYELGYMFKKITPHLVKVGAFVLDTAPKFTLF